jgi:hypothetical protein
MSDAMLYQRVGISDSGSWILVSLTASSIEAVGERLERRTGALSARRSCLEL